MGTKSFSALEAFSWKTKQEALQVLKALRKNDLTLNDFEEHVQSITANMVRTGMYVNSPPPKRGRRKQRTAIEKEARKRMLHETVYGPIKKGK